MNVFGRVWCEQSHKHIVLDKPKHLAVCCWELAADLWHLLLCDCRVTSVRASYGVCVNCARGVL